MATTTSVVQITVVDEGGYTKTFNIDEPKENLSLNTIKNALQPAIAGRWWLGNSGAPITGLKSAAYSTSTKVQIEGGEVIITPSELSGRGPSFNNTTDVVTFTFSIEGGVPQNYMVNTSRMINSSSFYNDLTYNSETNQITWTLNNLQPSSEPYSRQITGSGAVYITIMNQTIEIPIRWTV